LSRVVYTTSIAVVYTTLAGCAATGDPGGGAAHLPVSGAGPFRPLGPDPSYVIDAPTVLTDLHSDLDEPTVVARGAQLALWVTARADGASTIAHADALTTLGDGFGALYPALAADRDWEAGNIGAPSVLWPSDPVIVAPPDEPWILFYSGGGAIGWAIAVDGHVWIKAPGPALIADTVEEGDALAAPAVVRIDDRIRVYYLAQGKLWAAEAPFADVAAARATTWTRLDADPRTPERDPFLVAAPFAVGLGRVTARVAATAAGRARHDLYFSAATATGVTCGFASSYSGSDFELAAAPILPPMVKGSACAMTPYLDGALLLYVEHDGPRGTIAAATSP
jgi:hypothetical protein